MNFFGTNWFKSLAMCGACAAAAVPMPSMAQDDGRSSRLDGTRAVVRPWMASKPWTVRPNVFWLVADEAVVKSYWIGIYCEPADDSVRAQLDLEEDVGLMVAQVAPGSPARKAGLKPHDMIVKIDGAKVGDVEALIKAVETAADSELTLSVIRGGETVEIAIKPEPRPETEEDVLRDVPPNMRHALEWMRQVQPGSDWQPAQPFGFRVFHPGMLMPSSAKLPDGMKITIVAEGDEATKLMVEFEGETHETTVDRLDELPSRVRPHVERFLGGMPPSMGVLRAQVDASENEDQNEAPSDDAGARGRGGKSNARRFEFRMPDPAAGDTIDERLERRFDEMNRKLEELEKMLREQSNDDRDAT